MTRVVLSKKYPPQCPVIWEAEIPGRSVVGAGSSWQNAVERLIAALNLGITLKDCDIQIKTYSLGCGYGEQDIRQYLNGTLPNRDGTLHDIAVTHMLDCPLCRQRIKEIRSAEIELANQLPEGWAN